MPSKIPAGSSACSISKEEGEKATVEILAAVDYISCFLRDEVKEVVKYTTRYLSPDSEKYHKIWYKIHTTPDSAIWLFYCRTGPLQCLCDVPQCLIFLTIIYNRLHAWDRYQKMAQSFAAHFLKQMSGRHLLNTETYKNWGKTRLQESTFNAPLEIRVKGPDPQIFTPLGAVSLWWND